MHSFQEQLRQRLLATQQKNTSHLPGWLRRLSRSLAGGDARNAQFIRGLLWQYRVFIICALVANLGAGLAEAATLAVFSTGLNLMTAGINGSSYTPTDQFSQVMLRMAEALWATQPILVLIGLAVFFQILRSSLDFTGTAATVYLRAWLEGNLQRQVFTRLVNMRYSKIVKDRLGNLTSYSSQVINIGSYVHNLNFLINDATIAIAYIGVLFWLSWQFTIVAVIALALLTRLLRQLRQMMQQKGQQFLTLSVKLNERVLEYLQGLRLVHIFVREQQVLGEVNDLVNHSVRTRRQGLLSGAALVPLFQILTITGVAVFLAVGWWLAQRGTLTSLGDLVTYVFVLYRLMPRLATFNFHLGQASAEWPYLERIAGLLNVQDEELEYSAGLPPVTFEKSIELRDLTLRYPQSEQDTLQGLNLVIPKGSMIGLVGTSGAGKTSVFNLLLGFYEPTAGRILIDGVDLLQSDLGAWRRQLGVVDQDTFVFHTSIAENIRFGRPEASNAEVEAAAKLANAQELICELPEGYATHIGDRGYRLSGGQRQRIAIARAVLHNPRLLLFDEATSALDSRSEQLIQLSLETLRKERTIIVIAHRLSTIVKADIIVVLDNGRIVEQGTHAELVAKNSRYAALWRLQAEAGE